MRYSDMLILRHRDDPEVGTRKPKQNDAWDEEAWAALVALCKRGREFTADDLLARLDHPDPSHEANAQNSRIGPLFLKAKAAGLIEDTGRSEKSKQTTRHAGKITVWQPKRKHRLVRVGGK